MNVNGNKRTHFEFGEFRLHADERLLARGSERVPLSPRVFDLLTVLVKNQGKLVTKEEMLETVWADSVVEEGNINRTVSTLRKKLGPQSNGSDFIETVPRSGYRFVAPVAEIEDDDVEGAEETAIPIGRKPNKLFALASLGILLVTAVGAAVFLWPRGGAVETGGLANLTNNLAEDNYPEFSPDGKKIAFSSNRNGQSHIFVMNADGSNVVELTSQDASDYAPTWSPAGDQILFERNQDRNREIYIINADGSNQKRLTFNPTTDGGPPRFSPDGKRIVFARSASNEGLASYNFDIFVMNTDGGDLKQLTTDAEYDAEPIFSPDGSRIVFVSGRDGSFDVFVMNSDGSGQTNLTDSSDLSDTPIGWMPDGKQILFNRDATASPNIFQIWIMNADGTNPRQITSLTEKISRPNYSAASGSLIFTNNKTGNLEIYKMNTGNLPEN